MRIDYTPYDLFNIYINEGHWWYMDENRMYEILKEIMPRQKHAASRESCREIMSYIIRKPRQKLRPYGKMPEKFKRLIVYEERHTEAV